MSGLEITEEINHDFRNPCIGDPASCPIDQWTKKELTQKTEALSRNTLATPALPSKHYSWEGKELVPKSQTLGSTTIATPLFNIQHDPSLTSDVSDLGLNEFQATLKEQILTTDSQDFQALEEKLKALPAEEKTEEKVEENCFNEIRRVIAKLYAQSSKKEQEKHIKQANLTNKYSKLNTDWGVMQKELGARGLKFTGLALAVMMARFFVPESDHVFVDFFSNQGCPKLAEMFNAETSSRQKMVDGLSQIVINELNAMVNQSDSSKQTYDGVMDRILDVLRRAAQGVGG